MGITGNLETMELAELLQWLSQGQKTGTLVIDGGQVEKRIFFERGRIVSSASSDPKEHLGHFLVSHGYIDERQLAEAIRRQEQERALLGSVLVAMGAVAAEDVDRMLRLKAEEGIYELFGWKEGDFHFIDGELPAYKMEPIALDVTGIVLEATRRQDELGRIRQTIPSLQAVAVRVSAELPTDPEHGAGARLIVDAVDDQRTVEEISLETHASEYFVCEVLYPLVRAGRIKMVRPRELAADGDSELREVDGRALLKRAQKLLKDGEYRQAMRHLQAARDLEPDNREVAAQIEQAEAIIRRGLEKEGLAGHAVPRLAVTPEQMTKLRVSPKGGFLLSRINGSYDVASILKISPMTPLEALFELRELVQAGHVELGGKG